MADTSGMWRTVKKGLTGGGRQEKLGTFIGFYTPSILTILGVILYLRVGWVVGNVGLLHTIGIVVIAHLATIAMTLSVTLYSFGLAESIAYVWPAAPQRPLAALTVLVVSLLAARGAGLALRLQLPIMVGIGASIVALVIGVAGTANATLALTDSVEGGESFWVVFAVFFPAVTGIMAGVSLSGDLAKPSRSIPLGSIAAVLTGFAVYLAAPILLAIAATPEELVANNLIWFDIAGGLAPLILWGLWGAIFASAVGSILAGPRTLEAIVDDRVLPSPLGNRLSMIDGPGIPLLISAALALVAFALGDLNAVAPLLTMFFLTTYGTVNLVAGLEQLSADPSYRPTLKVP